MKLHSFILIFTTSLFLSCNRSAGKFSSYDTYPHYDGDDLELVYSPHSSRFRVWAPTASQVKLLLYNNGVEGAAYDMIDMDKSDQGTWTAQIDENLKGKFYTFQVKVNEKWLDETPGMWVKATGVNGKRAAIIDFNDTNPDGWENDIRPALKNFTDIILYELHVRDFSIASNSGIKNKGKFLAFTEHGTKNAAGDATGIDHLKELGVTHVHLLPSFDFASVDETKLKDNKYNWGYDPLNYNVPEGSYSTDPYNPVKRIKEFKQMVQSLHKANIRVIMDVVYNHTATSQNSHLNLLVPGYFYRHNADSSFANASGCGNETASERSMMRKFIVESVVYWANEYHVDGFRFDLMGIHDIVTMNEVRAALNKIDPSIFVYGEGWTASSSPLDEKLRAVKKNAKELDNIAVFSDDLRDALKGSWQHNEIPGFVAGVDSLENLLKFGIVAATQHPGVNYIEKPYANNPTQIINYVSCHDDLCLVDKLYESRPLDATPEELVRFNKLAQTVVFTSQGVPFIYAGEEIYRNKKGIHNTYQSPDSVNKIDWSFKTTHKDIFDYYKGLITLRRNHAAFRISTRELLATSLKFLPTTVPNVVGFTLQGHPNGDVWKDILVLYNGNRKAVKVTIPLAEWNVVCHDGQIKPDGLGYVTDTVFTIMPSSASIMYAK